MLASFDGGRPVNLLIRWEEVVKAVAGYLREAKVAGAAFNAFNAKHKEHPLGDTIGSRVMGGLTVTFQVYV